MTEQATLSDFDKENYVLPEIARGNELQREDDIVDVEDFDWVVCCGECGATMRRMGPINSGWDNKIEGSPALLDLFSCKLCNHGSVYVGYFNEDEKEIRMSQDGNGRGHKFIRFDNQSVKEIDKEDESEYVLGSDKLDIHSWEEP